LHDSAVKITQRGVVWNAIFHHAHYAKQNLTFLSRRLTFVTHVYFRYANAVQNDLAAQKYRSTNENVKKWTCSACLDT
jgi:hypothetical protein